MRLPCGARTSECVGPIARQARGIRRRTGRRQRPGRLSDDAALFHGRAATRERPIRIGPNFGTDDLRIEVSSPGDWSPEEKERFADLSTQGDMQAVRVVYRGKDMLLLWLPVQVFRARLGCGAVTLESGSMAGSMTGSGRSLNARRQLTTARNGCEPLELASNSTSEPSTTLRQAYEFDGCCLVRPRRTSRRGTNCSAHDVQGPALVAHAFGRGQRPSA